MTGPRRRPPARSRPGWAAYAALAGLALGALVAAGLARAGGGAERGQGHDRAEATDAARAESPWNDWRTLELRTRKMLFFTGRVALELSREPGREILETRTHARFMGIDMARSRTRTVLDATTGRPLEYLDFSPKRGRRYVFDEHGYTVHKLEPEDGFEAPLERWSVRATLRHAYPEGDDPEAPAPLVYDYYGMILQLRRAPLDRPGDEAVFYVATSDGPHAYRVRVGDVREGRRVVRHFDDEGKQKLDLREFRLRVTPDDPARAAEGFMNLEGETELWVESRSRTLLEINGKIPKVPGRVEIVLDAIR